MTTGTDVCTDALTYAGVLGVGNPPDGDQISRALTLLNDMLGQWGHKRWLVYHLLDTSCATTGAVNYSVGPGGDINITDARPDRIEAAYVRQVQNVSPNGQIDYWLAPIPSREDYARIQLKSMRTWPDSYFYDSAFPLGYIYPYPVPQSGLFELHILTKNVLSQIAIESLADDIILPNEYSFALKWNLARRCRAAWRYKPDAEINALAQDGLNTIRMSNVQTPLLYLDPRLTSGGRYNIYSDRVVR